MIDFKKVRGQIKRRWHVEKKSKYSLVKKYLNSPIHRQISKIW